MTNLLETKFLYKVALPRWEGNSGHSHASHLLSKYRSEAQRLWSRVALTLVFPVGKNNVPGRWKQGEQGLSVYSVAKVYRDVDIY